MLLAALLMAPQSDSASQIEEQSTLFRALMRNSPKLPFTLTEMKILPPRAGWKLDFSSSVAVDSKGLLYLLQRGKKADPIIVVDADGRVLRSWGRGLFKIPHSIRIDGDGNVWTTDAATSVIYKFTPSGELLLKIEVGDLPSKGRDFRGTTDIAFGPGGRVFIADGYGNARILEYSTNGKRIREWGRAGTGPGEFNLPHGIAIDRRGVIYVADRENGRIQLFNMDGVYQSEWTHLGKTFSLHVAPDGNLWIGTQPRDKGNGIEPWIVKVDPANGNVIGCLQSKGHHSIDLTSRGEPVTGARPNLVLWFRPTGP